MESLDIVLTYDFDPELVEEIQSVDPRLSVKTLSRPERLLMRGESLSEGEDAGDALRSLHSTLDTVQVILGWPDLTEELLARAPNLRWVHVTSAGVDTILDNPIFRNGRITVTNSAGVSAPAIGEYILTAMLMLAKQQPRYLRQQIAHQWKRHRTSELTGKTLGIVGLGAIGEETARRARAFGMRIVATRRSIREPQQTELVERLLPASGLPELLAESDFVALTLPLTKESERIIGEPELRRMKPGSYLINIARGPVIDHLALLRALQEGWIAGAALDVHDPEPLPAESPFWDLAQVLITPHISGIADRHNARITDIFCDNLRRYLAGQSLRNLVDPERGY
ncbi:MAG: D-2-hydroxyacid dehydrogenase [Dehalococcoidia bacterium]